MSTYEKYKELLQNIGKHVDASTLSFLVYSLELHDMPPFSILIRPEVHSLPNRGRAPVPGISLSLRLRSIPFVAGS